MNNSYHIASEENHQDFLSELYPSFNSTDTCRVKVEKNLILCLPANEYPFHINKRLRSIKAQCRSQESDRHPRKKSMDGTTRATAKSLGSVGAMTHLTGELWSSFYDIPHGYIYRSTANAFTHTHTYLLLPPSPAVNFLPKLLKQI